MRSRTGADVAIHNRGGIRAALDAGPVTRRDLFRILPFDNHLETLTMTGQQLSDLMERSIEGQGRSGLEFSGLVARVRRGGKFPEVVQFLVGGTPLDPEGTYRVTTNNFLASGGDAYKEFMLASERVTDPILQRDLLEEHFRAQGDEPVRPPRDNRFVLVD
jgi:2',3'-cyclic-nucleotide 2'-phosphodiesterase (5'-nucleotidase family)